MTISFYAGYHIEILVYEELLYLNKTFFDLLSSRQKKENRAIPNIN